MAGHPAAGQRVFIDTSERRLVADRSTHDGPPLGLPVPTLSVVSGRAFLAVGAAIGALGWGATALLTARPGIVAPLDPAVAAATVWTPLIVVMVSVGLFGTPDTVRFGRPFLFWGPANGLASLATVAALLAWLPGVTYWLAWALAAAVGYLGTGVAVRRAGGDGHVWVATAGCEVSVLVAGGTVGGPWPFVLLGAMHVLPLALEAGSIPERTGLPVWPVPIATVTGLLALMATSVR
jgi:hypothetical protein